MFNLPGHYDPSPASPAGIRIADYLTPKPCFNTFQGQRFTRTCSPAPGPFSNPIRGAPHPDDNAPPTLRLADFIAREWFWNLKQTAATPPSPDSNAVPNFNVPAQNPMPNPRQRNSTYIWSGKSGKVRTDALPPRRRAQRMKEKRDLACKRTRDRHGCRKSRSRKSIGSLRKEAEELMDPRHMTREDKIFLKQLRNLQFNDELELDLERWREEVAGAAAESKQREWEHRKRDKKAAKLWEEIPDEEASEEQKKKVAEFVREEEGKTETHYRQMEEEALRADQERQRAHDAMERKVREDQERLFREELSRKAEEQRQQQERTRQLYEQIEQARREAAMRTLRAQMERELREHRARMEKERLLQEERERRERERFLREERERLLREERERKSREEAGQRRREAAREEQARQAHAEQAHRAVLEEQIRWQFALYEGKWNELRTSNCIPPIDVREIPWPVLGVVSSAEQVTYQDVRMFLFHPLRPGVEAKTARDKVRSEVLRFHPDKFNARVLPKIQQSHQPVAQEIAGAVARILTRIMEEEQQK